MAEDFTFRHRIPVQIRFSDVDQFGHMNNSSYFALYDLAKTSYIRDVFGEHIWDKLGIVVANINADFLAPVFFSDDLEIETTVIHLGTLEHELKYKKSIPNEALIRSELKRCANEIAATDLSMQTIRDIIE